MQAGPKGQCKGPCLSGGSCTEIDVGQGVGYSDDLSLTVLTKLLNSAQFKQAKLAKWSQAELRWPYNVGVVVGGGHVFQISQARPNLAS